MKQYHIYGVLSPSSFFIFFVLSFASFELKYFMYIDCCCHDKNNNNYV